MVIKNEKRKSIAYSYIEEKGHIIKEKTPMLKWNIYIKILKTTINNIYLYK